MKKKLTYVISDIDKALAFEWVSSYLHNNFDLNFILIGKPESHFSKYLFQFSIPFVEIDTTKSSRLKQWFKFFFIVRSIKPDIIHTHLWIASIFGMTSSWLLRIPKRIFTRHYAAIHYREYPSGRKWDRLLNFLATDIVAISANVQKIVIQWDGAKSKKVHLINHGFDFSYFQKVNEKNIDQLRTHYKIQGYPIIGVISRYLKLKGIQYIIPAFVELKNKFPDAHLVLANAKGEYAETIKEMLSQFPQASYTEIEFENDLASLYRLFDVFIHVPIDAESEAFGQTYIEALVCGIPSVFTLSGVAPEFVRDKENAMVVPFQSSRKIYEAVVNILQNDVQRNKLIETGKKSVDQFQINKHLQALDKLYSN